jgi:hypothetical protein
MWAHRSLCYGVVGIGRDGLDLAVLFDDPLHTRDRQGLHAAVRAARLSAVVRDNAGVPFGSVLTLWQEQQ